MRLSGRTNKCFVRCCVAAIAFDTNVFVAFALAQQSEWETKFRNVWADAQAAEEAKNWAQAAELYAEVLKLNPHEPVSMVSRARSLCHLGRCAEAPRLLAGAVESGWNQADLLRSDPAFESLRGSEEFAKLFARIEQIEAENILVYVPPGVDATKPAPLIVAFHGRGENPHLFLPTWKEAADSLGAVVAAPRGPHRLNNGLINVWESPEARKERRSAEVDTAACARLLDEAIALAEKRCRIDPQRIVLAGYSQGGAVALELLAEQPQRFAGAFAQATLYRERGVEHWRAAAAKHAGRVYLLAGELDKLRPHSERANAELTGGGWIVRYDVVPGAGHEPPDDNTRRQVEAVRFVLGDLP